MASEGGKSTSTTTSESSPPPCSSQVSTSSRSMILVSLTSTRPLWARWLLLLIAAGISVLLCGFLAWNWLRIWGPLIASSPPTTYFGGPFATQAAKLVSTLTSMLPTSDVELAYAPANIGFRLGSLGLWGTLMSYTKRGPTKSHGFDYLTWSTMALPFCEEPPELLTLAYSFVRLASPETPFCVPGLTLVLLKYLGLIQLLLIASFWSHPSKSSRNLLVSSDAWLRHTQQARNMLLLSKRTPAEVALAARKLTTAISEDESVLPSQKADFVVAVLQSVIRINPEELTLIDQMADQTPYQYPLSRASRGWWSFLPWSGKLLFPGQ